MNLSIILFDKGSHDIRKVFQHLFIYYTYVLMASVLMPQHVWK